MCLIAISDSCNKGISQAGNFLWARIFITVSLALWIIPLAQAPALTRSAKLNAEICACSIFNSRSWAAYQSCDCSLSSVLKCDYHDYPGKNVGGTKQGPNRSQFFKGSQLKTSLSILSVSGVPVLPPSLLVELCRPCAQL